MKRLLTLLAIIGLFLVAALLSAQAPLNNANTYSINLGTVAITDTVSFVSENVAGASQDAILKGHVLFMQDLATAAKTDPALAAILTKWTVIVNDASGNQIFP